jgi:tetratricopeptide (TPR) repeat protein
MAEPPTASVPPTGEPPTVAEQLEHLRAPVELLGRYEVQGEVGRGGMGCVLRGRDPILGRDLAIKVLLAGADDHPEVVRRFLEEARVGGQLQHPGVVPVYELGRDANRQPYFTMKLVEGRTLAALLQGREDPSGDLSHLLGIFEQVCQAVAYAHSKGIIHRDLKPANVMVGTFGEVQVMDWGLAKRLGEPDGRRPHAPREGHPHAPREGYSEPANTQAGAVLGTPAYMAPEQALGDNERVDQRTDVFGLGAILCEILTGRPPYPAGSSFEALLSAGSAELNDARDRLAHCGADAELVELAQACLCPEPAGRPGDAGAVAARVRCYREGVEARLRQAELERAADQARAQEERKRRRLTLALAAATLLLVAGAGGGAWWLQHQKAVRAAATERDVTAALREARTLGDQARTLHGSPGPWEAALASALSAVKRAEALLDSGEANDDLRQRVATLKADLEQAESQRLLLAELEDIRMKRITIRNSRPVKGILGPLYHDAFRRHGIDVLALTPAEAADRLRPCPLPETLLTALNSWAQLTPENAERLHLAQVVGELDPDPGSVRNRWYVAVTRNDRAALLRLAQEAEGKPLHPDLFAGLAATFSDLGAHDEAIRLLKEGQARHPGDFWLSHSLALDLQNVQPPRLDEALAYARVAVALRGRSAIPHVTLGNVLMKRGELDQSVRCYRTALELDPTIAMAHHILGTVLWVREGDDAAIPCFRKAVELDPELAGAQKNLGKALLLKGQLDEAISRLRRAAQLDPRDAEAHNYLAAALIRHNEMDEAIRCYRTALGLNPKDATLAYNLGNALIRKGEMAEAARCFRQAIQLDPKLADPHVNLATLLHREGKNEEAIQCLRRALEINPKVRNGRTNLGALLQMRGELDEAIRCFRQAIDLAPDDAGAHHALGYALASKGEAEEAGRCYREAIRLNPALAEAHCNLGDLLVRQGEFQAGLGALRRGHELGSKRPDWRYPSAEWVRNAERSARLEAQLPALLRGEDRPADAAEAIDLARMCALKRMYAGAAHFSAEAFVGRPKLAQEREGWSRYNAACWAARAGAGQGEDAPKDEAEQARLRGQALAWLKAELATWARLLDGSRVEDRARIVQTVHLWQRDEHLAGMRDREALEKLPEAERKEWEGLWAEVGGLLKRAGE